MNVYELMTPTPVSVTTRTTIRQAWDALQSLDVRHLPVVNEDRELVGIVSDRDFGAPPAPPAMEQLLGSPRRSPDAPVATIMTGAPLSVEPDDDLAEVIDLMLENKVGAVPVVSPEGRVVGIVSYLDILRRVGDAVS